MEQREVWGGIVGAGWVRHAAAIDAHSAPFGDAARHALGELQGASVLDVGCGTGTTTVELVDAGAADVLGVDLSGPMLAYAQGHHHGVTRVRFLEGDVLTLDPGELFDAVYSRFGLMFFDAPDAAFVALRERVRPGGRLAFCAWAGPFDNPWMTAAVLASIPVLGPPELPGPGEPGPFSLCDPDHVRGLLEGAGWQDVVVDVQSHVAPHPAGSVADVASMLMENIPPLALGLATQPERAGELHALIVEALAPYVTEGAVHLPASALIVSARR